MNLNFRILGEGEPVVVLHGVFGASDNWQTVGKSLAEKFAVYLVDLRNHGLSPHSDEMNYPVMAQDIRDLIENENLGSAHIVGHSMGGKVAMELATSFPEGVRSLVVVDIAPKYYPPHHQEILNSFKTLDLKNLKSRKDADDALSSKLTNPGVRQFILKNLGRNDDGSFEWKLNHQAIEENIENIGKGLEEGKTFAGKSLFVNGSNSDYISGEDHELILRHFPKAQFKTVNGAGHWVHAEKPVEITSILIDFLT